MAENNNPASEPLQKSAQAASAVRGAVKTGKAIAAAAKGASAGGLYGAIAAFAWENRGLILKITIAATAVLLIPVIIICMLPSVIWGGFKDAFSPNNPDVPILNDSTVITTNLSDISSSIGTIMSEAMADMLTQIDLDFGNSSATHKEIINPYDSTTNYSTASFVSQYSASKNTDYQSVSIPDMERVLRDNKDKLYSYTKVLESRTRTVETVYVDEETGEEYIIETEVTEMWAVYTSTYNGEEYFADQVFGLSEEQKRLAEDYTSNLTLFLSDDTFN